MQPIPLILGSVFSDCVVFYEDYRYVGPYTHPHWLDFHGIFYKHDWKKIGTTWSTFPIHNSTFPGKSFSLARRMYSLTTWWQLVRTPSAAAARTTTSPPNIRTSFGHHKSVPQMASWSVQPYVAEIAVVPITHTRRRIATQTVCSNRPHIYALHAMWPKNTRLRFPISDSGLLTSFIWIFSCYF